MKATFRKLAESELVFGLAVVLIVLGYLYLRNGIEYFSGTSGGAYWDNMAYCRTHRESRMKIYNQLVTCEQIQSYRRYCRKNLDESILIDSTEIPCDEFLDEEDDYSPYDAY